jgi:hypothetical protein
LWGSTVRGESAAFFSWRFKICTTARIVFQLRVVAGTEKRVDPATRRYFSNSFESRS